MSRKDQSMFLAPASILDYRELARRKLPRQLFDYIDGGAYDEYTMTENIDALRRIRLRQRVLRDVSEIDLSVELFGERYRLPLALGPVGLIGMFARRGEVQAARAAEQFGVPFCESTVSICSIEELRAATGAPFWFQLYVMRDRGYAKELMMRALRAGVKTLVLTVDLAVVGARYRDTRNGMTDPIAPRKKLLRALDFVTHPRWLFDVALGGKPLTFGNLEKAVPGAQSPAAFKDWVDSQFDPSVTFADLEWVRENWPHQIVLKGILDPEDARLAKEAGANAIIISNHGGRQLDGVLPTAEALPRCVEAVGDGVDILVDGGIRSGLDVVKMLALGAKACLLGRAWAYAVAGGGEAGVRHILEIIEGEMRVAMALGGEIAIDKLGPHVLEPR